MAALAAAHADKADRVLLMPYTRWQDYRVAFLRRVHGQPTDEDPTGPSDFDKAAAVALLTLEQFQQDGATARVKMGERVVGVSGRCEAGHRRRGDAPVRAELSAACGARMLADEHHSTALAALLRLLRQQVLLHPRVCCGQHVGCASVVRDSYVDETVQEMNALSACFESSITALEILLSETHGRSGGCCQRQITASWST